jgi:fumarylacetoacetate (FAA) hydrolase
MKLATLDNGSRDGALCVVSRDGERYLLAAEIASTMQYALDHWPIIEPDLIALYNELHQAANGLPCSDVRFLAPLPRAYQWLDGSTFKSHLELMARAFGQDPRRFSDLEHPLMYQGGSDTFLAHDDAISGFTEDMGIDFEAEVGVIVDHVPMGIEASAALRHVRLLVLLNDISLRELAPYEMSTGFGWVQAKPSSSFAPVAVTPDELDGSWRDGRVCLPVRVYMNDELFGCPSGEGMTFSFGQLIAHAARTRSLGPGTIIGSGTISSADYATVGSTCIAERRAVELIEFGQPATGYMKYGDCIRMEVLDNSGSNIFGSIEQKVVRPL